VCGGGGMGVWEVWVLRTAVGTPCLTRDPFAFFAPLRELITNPTNGEGAVSSFPHPL